MRKLWLDIESTGLDEYKNGIIELACIDEDSKRTFSIKIKPFDGCEYSKDAEKVHGKSKKVIRKYTPEADAMIEFIDYLEKVKGNGRQLQIAGYNSRFDKDFIVQLFKRNGYEFWDYFNHYDIDVFALVKVFDLKGRDPSTGKTNKKLASICNTMGVKLNNAHDALADIHATRSLYKKITKKYLKKAFR